MHNLGNFPTRVTLESGNAIDNIFTTIPKNNLSISGLVTELSLIISSDHDTQLLHKINFVDKHRGKIPITKTSRKFTTENIKRFKSFL